MPGFSDYLEPFILNAVFRNDAISMPSLPTLHAKLYIGDPGDDGLSNAAAETTRQPVAFSAAVGSTITSSATVSWTNVSTTETITYVGIWDAASGGNFVGGAQLNAAAVLVAADDLDLTSIIFTLD